MPRLVFQPVSEPKQSKTRIHLGPTVKDVTTGMAKVVALGKSYTGVHHNYDKAIMVVTADPEGTSSA